MPPRLHQIKRILAVAFKNLLQSKPHVLENNFVSFRSSLMLLSCLLEAVEDALLTPGICKSLMRATKEKTAGRDYFNIAAQQSAVSIFHLVVVV